MCVLLAAMTCVSCSREDAADSSVTDTGVIAADTTGFVADPAPDATAENTIRDVAEAESEEPLGSATLTVGDRTWTFSTVACLFDEAAEQVEAEFAMTALGESAELYAEISAAGHTITIVDTGESEMSLTTVAGRFIRTDGGLVTATATFVPTDDPTAAGVRGTLDADCADA